MIIDVTRLYDHRCECDEGICILHWYIAGLNVETHVTSAVPCDPDRVTSGGKTNEATIDEAVGCPQHDLPHLGIEEFSYGEETAVVIFCLMN